MVTMVRPYILQADDGLLLAAIVETELPVERVQLVYHPRGWQVAVVRMDGEQILPTVYADVYDAEQVAAGIAVKCDITLICDDDADGDYAEKLCKPMSEGEYMDYVAAQLDAEQREPMCRMSAADWRQVEEEEIGADFSRYPFRY